MNYFISLFFYIGNGVKSALEAIANKVATEGRLVNASRGEKLTDKPDSRKSCCK